MRTTLTPFFRMYQLVRGFISGNTVLMDYPVLKTVVQGMDAHEKTLETLIDYLDDDSSPEEEDISLQSEVLVSKGYNLGKCLEDIGNIKGDHAMVKRVHISYSDLMRSSTNNKIQSATSILNEAKAYTTELAGYKIAKEDIDSLEACIAALTAANTKRAREKAEQRIKQLNLESALKDCKDDLQHCDRFIETLRLKFPEIYKQYNECRKEKEPSTSFSHIRVVDAETHTPVLNAQVLVYSTTRSGKNGKKQLVLKRRTGTKGEVRISNSEKDIYLVEANKLGCSPVSGKLIIADSRPVTLELSMKKLLLS